MLKRKGSAAALAVSAGCVAAVQAGTIDVGLEEVLDQLNPNDKQPLSVLVYLEDQLDTQAITEVLDMDRAPLNERHFAVVTALRDVAQQTQADLLGELDAMRRAGLVVRYEPFWIANCVRVDGDPAALASLADRDDVSIVYFNPEIGTVNPVEMQPDVDPQPIGTVEPGVIAVRAPEAWALGFDGTGVLVANIDTGVDGDHPALANRWAGVANAQYAGHPEWAWFDPIGIDTSFPYDSGSHGTHTMGSVLGGAPGDSVGVAPGAQWIASAAIDRIDIPTTVADAIESFQWMADPDGDPSTHWDVPDVCSNSWGVLTSHGYPACDETFWSFIDNAEAAGVVMLFSAGNEGLSGLRRPADRATDDYRSVAVAAVNANVSGWPIASFSSRGPTFCTPDGTAAIKPDIAAPGDDVRSSVPGGYSTFSGTSMASPHVNGVVALMRQACPDLTPDEIKQIMYDTAVDLGATGKDNDYGYGMIDAYEAVQLALSFCGPSPPRSRDLSLVTGVGQAVMVTLDAADYDGEPDPPGAITYLITSLPVAGATLTDPANSHDIGPGELPYELLNGGNEVLYTPMPGQWGNDAFEYAADDGGVPPDAGMGDPATVSVLVQFDAPTITTDALPDGYLGVAYNSFQLEADQGQPELTWSVGNEMEYFESDLGENNFETVGVPMGWHADDSAWSYALPFTFPFYDELYTTVWISSNGLLSFEGGNSSWWNSDDSLISGTQIAPLWDDLRTDRGGDIYIDDSVAGQVTIRWDVVTYSSELPVNVSCTLYENGRIHFHYGSGNASLSPTIGVSNGDEINYLLASYNNAPSLTDADSLQIAPPAPLPDGMSITPDGVIEGTPTEFGAFEPRVRVIDSLGRMDERIFQLTILEEGTPGDLTGDGVVNADDLFVLLGQWGACANCPEDLDGDDDVDADDLFILLGFWS